MIVRRPRVYAYVFDIKVTIFPDNVADDYPQYRVSSQDGERKGDRAKEKSGRRTCKRNYVGK